MKIYINGRFLSQRVTGVQRYAREIVSAIDKLLQEKMTNDEWCILAPKNITNDLPIKNIKLIKCGNFTGHLWEQLELPFYAKNGFLLNLCNCAPLVKRNQLVTIHDAAVAAFPSAYSWKFRTWYKIIYTICGKRSDKIATVSDFSRNELNQYFHIDKEKINVIYNGIEHMNRIEEDCSIIDDLNLRNEKYVLGVSSRSPSKNFNLILQVAARLKDIKFIIVGGINNKVFSENINEYLPNVIYTGYVTDEKLISLYRHAEIFVYPSLYEGFGIPPLEAISQGCPVIVSKCASLPEVCGEYAQYCEPNDEAEMARLIENNFIEKKEHVDIVFIKEKYSWKKSARLLLQCIEKNARG